MWCHLPTGFNRRRVLQFAVPSSLVIAFITTLFFSMISHAAPGINQTISFQGRLQYATGGSVADGFYNIQFKIYQDGTGTAAGNPGGSLEWTESYVNNNGTAGVEVKNGYFSVNLGSKNAFGNNVDWNQDTLWLSMNVAGTASSCTTFNSGACTADGEMVPMQRFTAVPYALNAKEAQDSKALEGKTASNFVQLSQGVQNDSVNNSASIFVNKTGTGGEFAKFQGNGEDVLTITNTGNLQFGNNSDHSIIVAGADPDTNGNNLLMQSGNGGSGSGSNGGNFSIFGGTGGGTNGNGGSVFIQGGDGTGSGSDGSILIGNFNKSYIEMGNANLSSGTQTINIGTNNTSGGTTNITIGSNGGASGGTTTVQAKNSVTINTNGTTRATFSDTANTVYFGNGVSASAPNNFTLQGTNSSATAVAGGSLTVQGGNATTGNANGGNLTLSGGTGSGTGTNGLVVLTTPTFSTVTDDPNCYTSGALVANSCTFAAASVNNSSALIAGFNTAGRTATLPDPTNTTAGRVIYVTAANGSNDFTLSVNGGGTGNLTSMRQNTTATMVWNGSDWTVAGASNSTTLQSAYDNTLQSAGGSEIIVSSGSNTSGLTIRDSSTNPVNGTLLEVQNASAGTLFSVNSNVPQYISNAGAETAGSTATTFPSNTWSAAPAGGTVSRHNTAGDYINTGQGSAAVTTAATIGQGVKNQLTSALNPNMTYNVSFSARLQGGTFTDMEVYYSADGTAMSVLCTSGKAIKTSVWTRIDCTFKAPASSITTSNALIVRQATGVARTFYIDNLSVTVAGDFNYATDGKVNDGTNFATNWTTTGAGSTVTRNTSDGQEASDSAQSVTTAGGANRGIRNKLSINPLTDTLYRVSVYAKSSTSFNDFAIRYSPNGGTDFVDCVDYNTQTISTSAWTQVTCYIKTTATAASDPQAYFIQSASAARTFMVDNFSMSLASNTAANVQIGGGSAGGPPTLFTLDKGASAPIAADNDALLGSMYYDTTIGKLQCYEADGWGACGSSPDNIVTISPEYNNAVMHGTGVGTMTSDLCSDALNINDGSSSQPTICSTNETYNFYKWTSPQASAQTYSIYVTYQLPGTFKAFTSGSTSLMGRTDSSNSSVNYQVYRSNSSGLTACGSSVSVSTGSQSSWQTKSANGTADPSTCGFSAGDSIVFKITASSSSNANAYIGNLGFTYSNR